MMTASGERPPILQAADMKAYAGEVHALIGENGAR